MCRIPRRGRPVRHRARRARGDRRQHRDRGAHPPRLASRLVLDGSRCPAVEPLDPRRRARAHRTLWAEVHRHRPGGGLSAPGRRPAHGPPRIGGHRRGVRPFLPRRRRRARHHDRGLERRPTHRTRLSVRGTSVAGQAVVAQLRTASAPQRLGRDRVDVPAPGDAPSHGLDGFRHDPAAAAAGHRRAACRDHGRSAGLRLGHTRRRIGRVAKRSRRPHHRPRRHRRDVGVGAVVRRGGRALRRGAHRRRASVPGRPGRRRRQPPSRATRNARDHLDRGRRGRYDAGGLESLCSQCISRFAPTPGTERPTVR